jgi:hypothetical protein
MSLQKYLLMASVAAFILAAFAAGGWPWIAIGVALFAASHI